MFGPRLEISQVPQSLAEHGLLLEGIRLCVIAILSRVGGPHARGQGTRRLDYGFRQHPAVQIVGDGKTEEVEERRGDILDSSSRQSHRPLYRRTGDNEHPLPTMATVNIPALEAPALVFVKTTNGGTARKAAEHSVGIAAIQVQLQHDIRRSFQERAMIEL